jgi:hypothetical protein
MESGTFRVLATAVIDVRSAENGWKLQESRDYGAFASVHISASAFQHPEWTALANKVSSSTRPLVPLVPTHRRRAGRRQETRQQRIFPEATR